MKEIFILDVLFDVIKCFILPIIFCHQISSKIYVPSKMIKKKTIFGREVIFSHFAL